MANDKIQPGMALVFTNPITVYNAPLLPGDVVKSRTTDESLPYDQRGVKGKVVGIMHSVMVETEDGQVITFNREQVKLRSRNVTLSAHDLTHG